MKIIIFLIIISITSVFAQSKDAYDYGFKFGLNYTSFGGQSNSFSTSPLLGFTSSKLINNNLVFGIDLIYDTKLLELTKINARKNPEVYQINYSLKTQQVNFAIKIGAFIDTSNNFLLSMGVGVLLKIRAKSKIDLLKLIMAESNETDYYIIGDETVEYPTFNPTINFSLRYKIKKWFFDLKYSYDFFEKNIINSLGGLETHTPNLSISLGYFFIGGKKGL